MKFLSRRQENKQPKTSRLYRQIAAGQTAGEGHATANAERAEGRYFGQPPLYPISEWRDLGYLGLKPKVADSSAVVKARCQCCSTFQRLEGYGASPTPCSARASWTPWDPLKT